MKINDILTLVNAGFTKADILAFAAGQKPEEKTETPEPQQPEPEPAPAPAAQEPNNELKDALNDVKKTIALMQQANLQNASQPSGANSKQTVEDVWKNFFEGDE